MTRFRRILQTDAFLRIVLTFILTVFLAASGYHVRAANDRFSSADKKLGGYKSSKWSTNRYSHLPLFYLPFSIWRRNCRPQLLRCGSQFYRRNDDHDRKIKQCAQCDSSKWFCVVFCCFNDSYVVMRGPNVRLATAQPWQWFLVANFENESKRSARRYDDIAGKK